MASSNPASPSVQAIRMSATPQLRRSAITRPADSGRDAADDLAAETFLIAFQRREGSWPG